MSTGCADHESGPCRDRTCPLRTPHPGHAAAGSRASAGWRGKIVTVFSAQGPLTLGPSKPAPSPETATGMSALRGMLLATMLLLTSAAQPLAVPRPPLALTAALPGYVRVVLSDSGQTQ